MGVVVVVGTYLLVGVVAGTVEHDLPRPAPWLGGWNRGAGSRS